MRGIFAVIVGAVLSLAATQAVGAPVDCEPARCAVQQALADSCSCDTATNHGRYVSCVAHVLKQLRDDGVIPKECKGKIQRCAARSTCGKAGFVTCQIPVDTCDLATLTCVNDPTLTCATDLDCGSKCKIKSSEDRCLARGGTVGASPTCCSDCVVTP